MCRGPAPALRITSSAPLLDDGPLAQADRRVEVALQRHIVSEPRACDVERHPPVDPEHIGSGRHHQLEQLAGAHAEVDAGHAEVGHADAAPCGSRATRAPRSRARSRSPAQLSKSCTACAPASTCARSVAIERSARRSSSRCHNAGSPYISDFVRGIGARGSPFDEVARDGERRAREPDQRHVELTGQDLHGLEHVRDVELGLERTQPREIGLGPERLLGDGPGAGSDVDPEPDRGDRHDDVAVEDRRIDAVATHRLERDLGGELGLADRVEDASLAADRAVLGKRATGLAHEPHRDVAVDLAAARGQERRVGRRAHAAAFSISIALASTHQIAR